MTPTAEHPGLRLFPQTVGKTAGAATVTDPSGKAGPDSGFAGLIESLGNISVVTDPVITPGSDSSPLSDDLQDVLPALPSTHELLSFNQAASPGTSEDAMGTTENFDVLEVKETMTQDETAATEGNATLGQNVAVTALMVGSTPGPEIAPVVGTKAAVDDRVGSDAEALETEGAEGLTKAGLTATPANTAGPQIAAAVTAQQATSNTAAQPERKAKTARDATAQPTTGAPIVPAAANALQAGPAFSEVKGTDRPASVARHESSGIEIRIDSKPTGAQTADTSTVVADALSRDKLQPVLPQASFIDALSSATKPDQPGTINSPQIPPDPVVISTTEPNWEVEFVDSIVANVTGEDAVIDLSLSPDNLGKVEVRVELRDGRADVTFVTETRDAARLFAQAEGRLSDLMQRHGLDLGGQASSHRDASPRQSGGQPAHAAAESDPAPLPRLTGEGRVNLVA